MTSTPSSASTCTIISAPVMDLPASGWPPVPAISKCSFAAFTAGPLRNDAVQERLAAARGPVHASYHLDPAAERSRRAVARRRAVLHPRLQHRVAVGGPDGRSLR